MAAKIQQRNEVVNRQCAELQKRLSADGFRNYIMREPWIESLCVCTDVGFDACLWLEGGAGIVGSMREGWTVVA